MSDTAWIIIANVGAVCGILGILNLMWDYYSRVAPWLLGIGLLCLIPSIIFGGLR